MAQDSSPSTPVTPADVANASSLNEATSLIRTMLGANSTAVLAALASITAKFTTGLGVIRLAPVTVANLPTSPAQGWICAVSNSNTVTWGAVVAGGGSNHVLVWYTGSVWHVFAA